jgi:amidase
VIAKLARRVNSTVRPELASLTEQLALLRERRISSRELLECCAARIARSNPGINALVTARLDQALSEAAALDEARARGESLAPLAGVPMALKDSIDTAGTVTTWGTPGRRGFVPARDAAVAARLRAAGAILLGKTNTPELTMSFETANPVHGSTRNPYDPSRSSGGSSGGACALVALGGAAFDVGSDTGGSIRLPAHFCGVAGLKPTSGRVPRTGHAIGPHGPTEWLTQLGPIARSAADLQLVLEQIAGPDPGDPACVPAPLLDPAAVELRGLRVALHLENGVVPPAPEVAGVVESAARALERAGARVREARPPDLEHTLALYSIIAIDGGQGLRRILRECGTDLSRSSLSHLRAERAPTPGQQAMLFEAVGRFRVGVLAFMQDHDLILCPPNARSATPPGSERANLRDYTYTMAWNLTGQPAAVVRAGADRAGLPIGAQLVARPWREDVALAAALCVERELGGWQPPEP